MAWTPRRVQGCKFSQEELDRAKTQVLPCVPERLAGVAMRCCKQVEWAVAPSNIRGQIWQKGGNVFFGRFASAQDLDVAKLQQRLFDAGEVEFGRDWVGLYQSRQGVKQ
jgi:hypothetical protein